MHFHKWPYTDIVVPQLQSKSRWYTECDTQPSDSRNQIAWDKEWVQQYNWCGEEQDGEQFVEASRARMEKL